jgi:Uma2 family endonuclease
MPPIEKVRTTAIALMPVEAGNSPYRITAAEFQRMVEAGVLPSDRRVYLWDGVLYEKMARKQVHAIAQSKLVAVLIKRLPDDWYVSAENPLNLDMTKTPLPDLAVVRGTPDDYPQDPPRGLDTALVVEVMNTSKRKDRETHQRACAAAGVPVYWIVDVEARVVWVYTDPSPPGHPGPANHGPAYCEREKVPAGGTLTLPLPGRPPVQIAVDEILARGSG